MRGKGRLGIKEEISGELRRENWVEERLERYIMTEMKWEGREEGERSHKKYILSHAHTHTNRIV